MHRRKRNVIGLFVISVLLFAIQAGLWTHSLAPAHTETDKQNIEGHHPPTDLPILAGSLLLIVAAAIASIPPHVATHRRRY